MPNENKTIQQTDVYKEETIPSSINQIEQSNSSEMKVGPTEEIIWEKNRKELLQFLKETSPAIDIDVHIKGKITEDKMSSFAENIFIEQAKVMDKALRNEYDYDPVAWLNSSTSRARFLIIQATDYNAQELGKVVMNASPLERILVVGLEGPKKDVFEQAVRAQWLERLGNKEKTYKDKIKDHFMRNGYATAMSDIELIESISLKDLLGPHLYIDDMNISFEKLSHDFPHFHVTLEEILCLGNDNALSEQLTYLSLETKLPYLPVCSEPFGVNESTSNYWRCFAKDSSQFLNQVASGKSALTLLGKETTGNDTYENVILSDSFLNSFTIDSIKADLKMRGATEEHVQSIEEGDINYLKNLFTDEALYAANASPQAITKTVSKANTKLGAMGALAVGKALIWNIVNRPVATAKGVEFAVASLMLDGGSDLNKELLDKKQIYKMFYDKILTGAISCGKSPDEALKFAAAELVSIYSKVEKENLSIQNLLKEICGANNWRTLGLEAANKVRSNNTKALSSLKAMPFLFAGGALIGVTGYTLGLLSGIPAAVGLTLGTVGMAGSLVSTCITGYSIRKQYQANSKNLPLANACFANANNKQFEVRGVRMHELEKGVADALKSLNNPSHTVELVNKLSESVTQTIATSKDIVKQDNASSNLETCVVDIEPMPQERTFTPNYKDANSGVVLLTNNGSGEITTITEDSTNSNLVKLGSSSIERQKVNKETNKKGAKQPGDRSSSKESSVKITRL
ncbi:hypothetical protein [Flavobacterium poyangense]|uniref:hypothetical protein n=1 Tax=Flavobacterium poyangense TaxID=2204302 RepID=UPI00141DE12E|nr:hypothetical protein [Flavobacterium sp. JXAS1]